jgi:UDP-4-amino-4,6-dideoxy-N-acetyl-beta-L-altrosamine transaminase
MHVIPYSRQDIDDADVDAVTQILRSDLITQGPTVGHFERTVSNYCGSRFGVAVNSGTSGLHIACLALGAGPGDWVWTSPNSFVASANAARYCGANVDFVDIDPGSLNLCPNALAAKLEIAAKQGRLPKVLIPVHFAGEPCDMNAIGALAKRYGVAVIEDAAHALGARYDRFKIGASYHSDLTVLSFHPVKAITTGEGGMVLTQSPKHFERLCRLRSHGITRDSELMARQSEGSWYYEQLELGYNFRLTDIQAALGANQMKRLDSFVARRHEKAEYYDDALRGLPLDIQKRGENNRSALHLYVVRLRLTEIKRTRREVFDALKAAGINVNVHYIPIHLQPYFMKFGFQRGDYPQAESYYEGAITLPLFPGLAQAEQAHVVDVLKRALA